MKKRIKNARVHAALSVNRELIIIYWQIGRSILQRQGEKGWGSKVIERLANDLRREFPDMKGLSRANLFYMRAFADAYPDVSIVQQLVGQLPWGHNVTLITKIKDPSLRDIHKPVGISEYNLAQSLPDDLKGSLPTIEELEKELRDLEEVGDDE